MSDADKAGYRSKYDQETSNYIREAADGLRDTLGKLKDQFCHFCRPGHFFAVLVKF